MEKENNSEKTKITYEDFKSIQKMLDSSESDRDLGISILGSVDQKQALPYILFTLMNMAYVKQNKSMLWRMYSEIPVCKNLSKIVNSSAKYGDNPYDYKDPGLILELAKKHEGYPVDACSKSYLDKLLHYMTIDQITDSILVQEDPRQYFPLEVDITEMIIKMFEDYQDSHTSIARSVGLSIKFDIQAAINMRKNAK
jgi:hypothetical protein